MNEVKTSLETQSTQAKDAILLSKAWTPLLRNWRDVVEDLLRISRERKQNKLSMYLQSQLVLDTLERQAVIKDAKKIIKNPDSMADIVGEENEVDLTYLESQLEQEKLILKVLREVADGHLWRIFYFNRPLLYFMGRKAQPSYLQLSEGFFRELQTWSGAITDRDISHFILCDITNFAGIGDVIIRYADGQVEVKEIKSSKSQRGLRRRQRLLRQERSRTDLEKLANYESVSIDNQSVRIIDAQVPYKTKLKLVEKALKDSEVNGYGARKLNSFLSLVCIDQQAGARKKIDLFTYLDTYHDSIFDKNDRVVILDSFLRSGFSPNMTPWSVFPFSEQLIADLLLGKKVISYGFNVDEFFRLLKKDGWEVTSNIYEKKQQQSAKSDCFCRIRHKELYIGIPWSLISQIIFDTLTLDSVLEFFQFIYENKLKGTDGFFLRFDEAGLWK